MPARATATPNKVLSAINNLPKKVKSSSQLRDRRARKGKENTPSSNHSTPSPPGSQRPASRLTASGSEFFEACRWAPKDGMIIIKVSIPCMDDLWRLKVPQHIMLVDFLPRVEAKVGFPVAFSYAAGKAHHRERAICTEGAFQCWVAERISKGKNRPLIARVRV